MIIGVLGTEAAGPVLEQLDETSLRNFTHAMSGLNRIDASQVRATIAEFLSELELDEEIKKLYGVAASPELYATAIDIDIIPDACMHHDCTSHLP